MSQRRRARVGTLKYTQVNMGGSRRVGLRGSLAGAACYSQAELLLAHKIGNLAEEEVAAAMRRTASRSSRVLLLLSHPPTLDRAHPRRHPGKRLGFGSTSLYSVR